MWIVCLADYSHEMPSLIFSETRLKHKNLIAKILLNALRIEWNSGKRVRLYVCEQEMCSPIRLDLCFSPVDSAWDRYSISKLHRHCSDNADVQAGPALHCSRVIRHLCVDMVKIGMSPVLNTIVNILWFFPIRTLWANSADDKFMIFFFFFFFFDITCKLYPSETICIKCQILFLWKNKK